jgi:hypothetical protein
MKYQPKNAALLSIGFLAATVLTGRVSAQIISNGGFELPGGLASNTSLILTNGDPRLLGWTIGGAGVPVAYVNGQNPDVDLDFAPVEGSYHIAFNGGDMSAGTWIAQSFDTKVGEVYEVTFYMGRLGPNRTPGVLKLQASVRTEGGLLLTNVEAIAPVHGYSGPNRFTFIAASTRSTLRFLDSSTQTVATDLLLDAVSVAAGPLATIEVSEVAICWVGSTNRTYQVQYASGLATNTWVNVGSPVQGTGTSTCVHDAVLGQERRFYHVVPLP